MVLISVKCGKVLSMLTMCASLTALTIALALPSSTLLQLSFYTETTVEKMSLIFPIMSVCYLLGSFPPMFIRQKRRPVAWIQLTAVTLGVANLAAVPWSRNFYMTVTCMGLASAATGFFEAISVQIIEELAGSLTDIALIIFKASAMFGFSMQTMFVVGFTAGVAAPLVANTTTKLTPDDNMNLPYWIVAAIALTFTVGLFLSSVLYSENEPERRPLLSRRPTRDEHRLYTPVFPPEYTGRARGVVIFLMTFMFALNNGVRSAFKNFIATYVLTYLSLTPRSANYMQIIGAVSSLFSLTLVIFFVRIFGILTFLTFSSAGILFASLPFLLCPYTPMIWITCGLVEAAYAMMYSASFAVAYSITGLTNKITSLLIMSQCVGEIATNYVVGQIIRTGFENWPLYTFGSAVLATLIFIAFLFVIVTRSENRDYGPTRRRPPMHPITQEFVMSVG